MYEITAIYIQFGTAQTITLSKETGAPSLHPSELSGLAVKPQRPHYTWEPPVSSAEGPICLPSGVVPWMSVDTHRNQLYRKMSVTQFGIAQFTQTKSPPFSSAQTNVSAFYHQPTPHSGCRGNCPNFISTPPTPTPQMPFCPFTVVYTFHGNPSWQKTFPWQRHSIGKSRFHSGEDRRSPFSNVQSTMMIISEWKNASHITR